MRARREWFVLVPLGALALLAVAALATGGRTGLIEVSGASPFRSCELEAPVFNPNSRMTVDSEVEPSLAVDPTDKNVLIGVYQQDRWSGGQARGIAGSVSHDGGQTWQQIALPFSQCARDSVTSPRAGDPWVSFGGDGTAYVIATGTGIAVSVSRDEGLTWSDPASVDERAEDYFPDKPTITADPGQPGIAYAVWARILSETSYDAMFAKTADFGRTWSTPQVLIEHVADGGAVSSQILVDPDGATLYHLTNWEEGGSIGHGGRASVRIQRSADGGATWSDPETAFENRTLGYGGGPQGFTIRTAVEVPDFAIAPDGTLYATWQDARFSGGRYDEIAFSSSADGGMTWSEPRKLNTTVGDLGGLPMVAVNASGAVAVSYYTFHVASGQDSALTARVFLAESSDGGETFTTSELAGPVDLQSAPRSLATGEEDQEFAFLGDYAGLDAVGSDFAVLFALPNPARNDPADVFLGMRAKQFRPTSMQPAASASTLISASPQRSGTPVASAPSLDALAGAALAYASPARRGPGLLYRSELDGSQQITVTELKDTWILGPRWSPDGTQIAFIAYDFPHDRSTVRIVGVDGSHPRTPVTDRRLGSCSSPAWSPDGTMLAFECGVSGESRLKAAIYVANADGSRLSRVTRGSSAAWSPDGTALAFERALPISPQQTQFDLFTIAVDGSDEARLTSSEDYDERHPSWSPDGAELTFDRAESQDPTAPEAPIGPEYVFVMGRDGADPRQVMPEGTSFGNNPRWATDDLIYFAAYGSADDDTGIGVVSATGSAVNLIRGPFGEFDVLLR